MFYLGTLYSAKLAANVIYNGQSGPIEMGCYGLGKLLPSPFPPSSSFN